MNPDLPQKADITKKAKTRPDPRMPTDPTTPAYALGGGPLHLFLAEAWDHLWPWNLQEMRQHRLLWAITIGLAVMASFTWIFAGFGRVGASALIGIWFGWSVFECVARWFGKRYVKDGPWWKRNYRVASVMDLICYVSLKNMIIGATLFVLLRVSGILPA